MKLSYVGILIFLQVYLSFQQYEENQALYFVFYPYSRIYKISISVSASSMLLNEDTFNIGRKTVMFGLDNKLPEQLAKRNQLIDAYLETGAYNVIFLDYTAYELGETKNLPDYIMKLSKLFGEAISNLILSGIPADSIELVGHSVGAEIVSIIADFTSPKVGLLVGLDPTSDYCLQLFNIGLAKFTIGVWTDRGGNADASVRADANFVVNNGTGLQPGCRNDSNDEPGKNTCSHFRAVEIWMFAVKDPMLFVAQPCNATHCNMNVYVAVNQNVRLFGDFYFKTSSVAPYSLGIDGAGR